MRRKLDIAMSLINDPEVLFLGEPTTGLDLQNRRSMKEAGLQALQAWNDMVLSSSYSTQIPFILEAIKKGEYSEQQLDQSVERLLTWKVELGLIK